MSILSICLKIISFKDIIAIFQLVAVQIADWISQPFIDYPNTIDPWNDEDKFKKRLEEANKYAGFDNIQCGTKAVMLCGLLTNSINFTYQDVKNNLEELNNVDKTKVIDLLKTINESIKKNEDSFPNLKTICEIFNKPIYGSKLSDSKYGIKPGDYMCGKDVEFYTRRISIVESIYNNISSAKPSVCPVLAGIYFPDCPYTYIDSEGIEKPKPNCHYVILVNNPSTGTKWVIDPKQTGNPGSVYRLSELSNEWPEAQISASQGSRFGFFRYKSTKKFVPVERYWFLKQGKVDEECWIERETDALRVKLSNNSVFNRKIIGVYHINTTDDTEERIVKDPTKAVHVKMHKKHRRVGIVGVFNSKDDAEKEVDNTTVLEDEAGNAILEDEDRQWTKQPR